MTTNAFEMDSYWLKQRVPNATPEQLEHFCEWVSKIWIDDVPEETARKMAFNLMNELKLFEVKK
jgi:hypothetical protein